MGPVVQTKLELVIRTIIAPARAAMGVAVIKSVKKTAPTLDCVIVRSVFLERTGALAINNGPLKANNPLVLSDILVTADFFSIRTHFDCPVNLIPLFVRKLSRGPA